MNQTNNQANPPVDDIFAETEQNAAPQASSQPTASGIETHKIGLAAGDGEAEPVENASSPWFKIVVISIVVIILALGGYLAYSKFMAPEDVNVTGVSPSPAAGNQVTETTPTETPVVTPVAEEEDEVVVEETSEIEGEVTPLIPGVNDLEEGSAVTPVEEEPVIPMAPVDTDQDGLTDEEEASVGSNINIVDTDGDGLSDYEEVKIYTTNPLLADTDGDGYSDGDEVSNGYNPAGEGKLQGNQ